MASERLEGLAREMYAAELEVFEDGVAYGRPGVEWDCLSEAPTGKPRHRAWASAACEYFGFVDAKGEVVVPERGAVMDVVRRIENFRLAMADHRARLPIDVRLEFDACLLDFRASWSALQGGDDG